MKLSYICNVYHSIFLNNMCSICITSVIQFSVKFKARTPLVLLETSAEGNKLQSKANTLSPKKILHKFSQQFNPQCVKICL